MSIASFISTIPQFVNERYNPYSIHTSSQLTVNNKLFSNFLCNNTINETLDSEFDDSKYTTEESMLFAVFLIGSIIKGIGHTPMHPLGISYIDDFASEDNSAMYIGESLNLQFYRLMYQLRSVHCHTFTWSSGWLLIRLFYYKNLGRYWLG